MRYRSKLLRIITFLAIGVYLLGCSTQKVEEDYKWDQQALILVTDDQNNPAYKGQIALLDKEIERLKQREILVFLVGPKYYRIGLDSKKRTASVDFYQHFNDPEEPFEILLVDLDGKIIMRENRIFTPQELYAMIDEASLREQ